jgi:hypothetical protein
VIAPKFDELSDKYTSAIFLKVRYWTMDLIFKNVQAWVNQKSGFKSVFLQK